MKYLLFLLTVALFFIAACDHKTEPVSSTTTSVTKYDFAADTSAYSGEMKRYWLVLLKKGPNRTQDSIGAAKIQAGHMAGPMGHDGDLRGIFIMNCKDSSEVEQFVNTDTAVITGRLKMEYYPWWSEKGKYIFK